MTELEHGSRRPGRDESADYYQTYIGKVPDGNCVSMLESQIHELETVFASVSETQASTPHPPYTWTIKQVVGHLIDAERIFADRLHRFSCGDTQPQPGMEQEPYVANQDYMKPSLKSLVDELLLCRRANLLLVRRLRPAAWDHRGIASGNPFTVRALIWILAGHIEHHLQIIRRRLGKS
jgi:hypothetical protein